MNYWVYENDVQNHARVHRSDCRYYKNRKSPHLPYNRWSGPYPDRKTANAAMNAAGNPHTEECKHCL